MSRRPSWRRFVAVPCAHGVICLCSRAFNYMHTRRAAFFACAHRYRELWMRLLYSTPFATHRCARGAATVSGAVLNGGATTTEFTCALLPTSQQRANLFLSSHFCRSMAAPAKVPGKAAGKAAGKAPSKGPSKAPARVPVAEATVSPVSPAKAEMKKTAIGTAAAAAPAAEVPPCGPSFSNVQSCATVDCCRR